MPLELRREIEVTQARMAVEHEAVHLPCFALVPVGARVHRDPRLGVQVVVGEIGLQDHAPALAPRRLDDREQLIPAVAPGGAVGLLLRLRRRRRVTRTLFGDGRRRHPVDATDEREVVASELLLAHLRAAAPRVATHPDDDIAECSAVLDDRVAELGLQPGERVGRLLAQRGYRLGLGRAGRLSQRRSAPASPRATARPGLRS